jgi:hypothetical protein
MASSENLVRFIGDRHHLLQRAWTDETAHPKYRPLPEDKLSSYGQCFVSSVVMLDEIEHEFPDDRPDFRLVGGEAFYLSFLNNRQHSALWGGHVWLEWRRDPKGERSDKTIVIDTTADQLDHYQLPWRYVCMSLGDLVLNHMLYEPLPGMTFNNVEGYRDWLREDWPGVWESMFEPRLELFQYRYDSYNQGELPNETRGRVTAA